MLNHCGHTTILGFLAHGVRGGTGQVAFPGDGDTINSPNSGEHSWRACPGTHTAGAVTSVISWSCPSNCAVLCRARGGTHVQCHTVCPAPEPAPSSPSVRRQKQCM